MTGPNADPAAEATGRVTQGAVGEEGLVLAAGTNPGDFDVRRGYARSDQVASIQLPEIEVRPSASTLMHGPSSVGELSDHLVANFEAAGSNRRADRGPQADRARPGLLLDRDHRAPRDTERCAAPAGMRDGYCLGASVPEKQRDAIGKTLHQQIAGPCCDQDVRANGQGPVGV